MLRAMLVLRSNYKVWIAASEKSCRISDQLEGKFVKNSKKAGLHKKAGLFSIQSNY